MTRLRLREARPDGEAERRFYTDRYPAGYAHDAWPDHVERVAASVEFIRRWQNRFTTAADLSCGDGAILRALASGLDRVWLGDLNPVAFGDWPDGAAWMLEPGALPDSLACLPERVDLFVCSETIEHLADPDEFLERLTAYARYLFLSTPVAEPAGSGNTEHYWSWDVADVGKMLADCGWSPVDRLTLTPQSTRHLADAYRYQLWLAVSR